MWNRTTLTVICGLFWPCVLTGTDMSSTASRSAAFPGEYLGHINGVVVDATSGTPIAGAYVGVGDFGDAGGSNLARFKKQGLYAYTRSDSVGRFELIRIALCDHPLVVTHPEYVRHDETVTIRPASPGAQMKISLKPAAQIRAVAVDADARPITEPMTIRLHALDGHRFLPPGKHRHLSAFASATWMESNKIGSFLFTELAEGEYSVDVMNIADRNAKERTATYHGGIAQIRAKAGQTEEIRIEPENHRNAVTVKLSTIPFEKPEVPAMVLVNRNAALLIWDDHLMHHIEDHRLGRITLDALILGWFSPEDRFTIHNLPPGLYSFFVGPVVSPKGLSVNVAEGQDTTVTVDWLKPDKVALVNLWTFWRRVSLPHEEYQAAALCQLLTERARPVPEIKAAYSCRNETIRIESRDMMIWEILEAIHAQKGWAAREEGNRTLILGPPSELETDVPSSLRRKGNP